MKNHRTEAETDVRLEPIKSSRRRQPITYIGVERL